MGDAGGAPHRSAARAGTRRGTRRGGPRPGAVAAGVPRRGQLRQRLRARRAAVPARPGTSVKGMLRARYEAVTNSRMGVFGSREPLGYRADSRSALKLRPVLLKLDADGAPQAAVAWPWLNYHGNVRIPAVALPAYT